MSGITNSEVLGSLPPYSEIGVRPPNKIEIIIIITQYINLQHSIIFFFTIGSI